MVSQAERILHYLRAGGKLTQLDALKMGMGLRLSARVDDLKRAGYAVHSEMVRRGDATVAEYWMPHDGELF